MASWLGAFFYFEGSEGCGAGREISPPLWEEGCFRTRTECITRYSATRLKILIFLLNIKIIL